MAGPSKCDFPTFPILALPGISFPPPLPTLAIPVLPSFKCVLDKIFRTGP
jgi:hypothetical protein